MLNQLFFSYVCVVQWMIRVPDLEKVRLTFTAFDLVPESCGDFVDIYDGASDGAAQLGEN